MKRNNKTNEAITTTTTTPSSMHFRLNNKVDSRQQNCAIIANAQKSEREEGREEEVEQSKERERGRVLL